MCLEQYFDPLVREVFTNRLRDVGIFRRRDLRATFEDGHPSTESMEGLGEFKAHVPAAQHDHVRGLTLKIECFDVSHRFCVSQARNVRHHRTRPQVQKQPITGDRPTTSVV